METEVLLYIGASYPQLPGLKCAKESSYPLVVVDRNINSPGMQVADIAVNADATDVDTIQKQLRQQKLIPVRTYGVADYAYRTIGVLCEEYGLTYGNQYLYSVSSNKSATKDKFMSHKVLTPQAVRVGKNERYPLEKIKGLAYPVIVKPSSSYNSQGVSTLDVFSKERFESALDESFSFSDCTLVEEYVHGHHYNIDLYMGKSRPEFVAMTRRFFLDTRTHLAKSGIQYLDSDPLVEQRLFTLAIDAVRCIGLHKGPATVDIIDSDSGAYVLEVSPHYHSISTNYFYSGKTGLEEWFLLNKSVSNTMNKVCVAGYYNYFLNKKGTVSDIKFDDSVLEGEGLKIEDILLLKDMGSSVCCRDGYQLVAVVWFTGTKWLSEEEIDSVMTDYLQYKIT